MSIEDYLANICEKLDRIDSRLVDIELALNPVSNCEVKDEPQVDSSNIGVGKYPNEYVKHKFDGVDKKLMGFVSHVNALEDTLNKRINALGSNDKLDALDKRVYNLENECALVEYVDSIEERVNKLRNICNERIDALYNEVGAISALVTTKCDNLNTKLQSLSERLEVWEAVAEDVLDRLAKLESESEEWWEDDKKVKAGD